MKKRTRSASEWFFYQHCDVAFTPQPSCWMTKEKPYSERALSHCASCVFRKCSWLTLFDSSRCTFRTLSCLWGKLCDSFLLHPPFFNDSFCETGESRLSGVSLSHSRWQWTCVWVWVRICVCACCVCGGAFVFNPRLVSVLMFFCSVVVLGYVF